MKASPDICFCCKVRGEALCSITIFWTARFTGTGKKAFSGFKILAKSQKQAKPAISLYVAHQTTLHSTNRDTIYGLASGVVYIFSGLVISPKEAESLSLLALPLW